MKKSPLSFIIGLFYLDFFLFNQLLLAEPNNFNKLKDSIFYLPDGEVIALSKGRYQTENTVFFLSETMITTDINNDSLEDFFVILTELHQGIQVNNYIAVFLGSNKGSINNVDTIIIDNQIEVQNMTFRDKSLTVEFRTYSPHQQKKFIYQFDNISKTLIPLTIETEKESQEMFIIERDSNTIENNNSIQIQF